MSKLNVSKVFVPGGMPVHTYVSRNDTSLEISILDAKEGMHKLVSVTGPTKSGKTVLVSRMFDESKCVWIDGGGIDTEDDFWGNVLSRLGEFSETSITQSRNTGTGLSGGIKGSLGFGIGKAEGRTNVNTSRAKTESKTASLALSNRTAAILKLKESLTPLVIDDFHYLDRLTQSGVVKGLKSLIFNGLPVVIVAVPHKRYDVLQVQKEMTGRLQQLKIPDWEEDELTAIATEGLRLLNLQCTDSALSSLASEACGSPHLMQEFCKQWLRDHDVWEKADSDITLNDPSKSVFSEVARNTGKYIFEELMRANNSTTSVRRSLALGGVADIYELVLLSLAKLAPGTGFISYKDIRLTIKSLVAESTPQKRDIVRALRKLSNVAASDDASVPVIEWDEKQNHLYISDPFLAFFLKHGLKSPIRESNNFRPGELFGSIAAELYEKPFLEESFFAGANFEYFITEKPLIIFGRRGTGKTSLLQWALAKNSATISIELVFYELVDIVARLGNVSNTEYIAKWEELIWLSIFKKAQDGQIPGLTIPGGFEVGIDFKQFRFSKESANEKDQSEASELARTKILRQIKDTGKSIQVLVDSPESYRLESPIFTQALVSFMECCSLLSRREQNVNITFSLPAEYIQSLSNVLSNPIKQLGDSMQLNWTARELMQLAAKRYRFYLKKAEIDYYDDFFGNLNIGERESSLRMWRHLFPRRIVGENGLEEDPVSYILRHTQLNPRHLLIYLNSISEAQIEVGTIGLGFSSQQVIQGVSRRAPMIAHDMIGICSDNFAFSLSDVCRELLPSLGVKFSYEAFRICKNAHTYLSKEDDAHVLNALLSIGIIGIVCEEKNNQIFGEFNYSMRRSSPVKTGDSLCVHPIFTASFGNNSNSNYVVVPHSVKY